MDDPGGAKMGARGNTYIYPPPDFLLAPSIQFDGRTSTVHLSREFKSGPVHRAMFWPGHLGGDLSLAESVLHTL